jgi:DNA-directed RNA polymerase subunit RPC12/RpoP
MVQKEYRCKVCGATFDSEREVDKHNRTTHPEYTCNECGRKFKTESEFRLHYLISHPEETPVR